jgi:hypothetical protein
MFKFLSYASLPYIGAAGFGISLCFASQTLIRKPAPAVATEAQQQLFGQLQGMRVRNNRRAKGSLRGRPSTVYPGSARRTGKGDYAGVGDAAAKKRSRN